MSEIVSLNRLVERDGIFVVSGSQQDFAYSDGETSENYLRQVFSSVDDLSSQSKALQDKIIDWPSEYHISYKRANLLRGLDLSQSKRVLELGSGCGAISRYLGELGLQVDAIEGSQTRARLGRMRCKDLPNVQVVNANYNELQIPNDYYDLVLFVGVIEYASMFYPEAESDYAAAQKILSQASRWICADGAVVVAIENRLGLKYILGQNEDHYHKRYIGIDNYRQSTGMATYSRKQWRQLAKHAGFAEQQCLLPFPDYKVPEVVLSESYVEQHQHAFNHLEGVYARDYYSVTERSVTEPISWQAACQGGFLPDVANSFCLILGQDETRLKQIAQLDFYHGPVLTRHPQYVVDTIKHSTSEQVIKRRLFAPEGMDVTSLGLQQDINAQEFIAGDLLSTHWLRNILVYNNIDEFNQQLIQYYHYLQNLPSADLAIDLLPNNIIVDDAGAWHGFDQEWQAEQALTPDYVFFRAALNFIVRNWFLVPTFLAIYRFLTVKDFVRHALAVNGILLSDVLQDFSTKENQFQKRVGHAADVDMLLDQVFELKQENFAVATLTLATSTEPLQIECSYRPQQDKSRLRFDFTCPDSFIKEISLAPYDLRFHGDLGFFKVHQLSLHKAADNDVLFKLDANAIAAEAQANNATFMAEKQFWCAHNEYPLLQFTNLNIAVADGEKYYFEVELSHQTSSYYSEARAQFIAKNQSLQADVNVLKNQLQFAQNQISQRDNEILARDKEILVRDELVRLRDSEIAVRDDELKELRTMFLVRLERKVKKIIKFGR